MPEIGEVPTMNSPEIHTHFPKGGSKWKRASELQPSRTADIGPMGERIEVARFPWIKEPSDPPIKNEALEKIIGIIDKKPEKMHSKEWLEKIYDQITELDLPDKKVAEYLGRIAERHQELTERETRQAEKAAEAMRSPEEALKRKLEGQDLEVQRKIVIPMIEAIEDSARDCLDYANALSVRMIEATYPSMRPELVKECQVRIALHDSSELILQANGKITRKPEERGLTIGNAFTEAKRRRHHITKTTVEFLFGENIKKVNFSLAWNLLQEVNFRYIETLDKINQTLPPDRRFSTDPKKIEEFVDDEATGKTPANYFTDSNPERREAVYQCMVNELKKKKLDEREARKSLQLAEKLATATLENPVFNTSMAGSDDLSEIIYLSRWRKGRAWPGRTRGPLCHENLILGFGSSWLRSLIKHSNEKVLSAGRIKRHVIAKIREGGWEYYGTVAVGRYQAMKEAILETSWKPMGREAWLKWLRSAVAYFNTCDSPKESKKTGPLRLRVLWALGVYDTALADIDLGWTTEHFTDFTRALTKDQLSPSAGHFLLKTQQQWIEKFLNLESRITRRATRQEMATILKGGIASLLGGKREK